MQCSTLITSPYSAMLKTRNAAIKLRNGSPKFKDVIRERCRERIRSRRTALFDNSRNLSNGQDELSCFLRKELQDIYANLSDEDSGFSSQASMSESEPQSAEEVWLMDEYDRMIATENEFLQNMLDEKLICPLCQRAALTGNEQEKLAICQGCNARISAPEGLSDLEFKLNTAIDEHQQLCLNIPSFIQAGDGSNSVYMVCYSCSQFEVIV